MKFKTIFQNIFFTSAILLTISILCNIVSMVQMKSNVEKQQLADQGQLISNYSEFVDDSLTNAQNVIAHISALSSLERLVNDRIFDSVGRIRDLEDLERNLNNFVLNFVDIEGIFVFSDSDSYLYTQSGSIFPTTFFANRYKGDYTKWQELLQQTYRMPTLICLPDEILNAASKKTTKRPGTSKYLISTLFIDGKREGNVVVMLDENLMQMDDNAYNRSIYLVDEEKNVLLGSAPNESLSEKLGNYLDAHNEGDIFIPGDGVLSIRTACLPRLRYIMFTPEEKIFETVNQSFWTSTIGLIVVYFILILFTLIFSHSFSGPYRSMLSVLKGHLPAENETFEKLSESELISRKVNELISTVTDLRTTVNNGLSIVTEAVLFKKIIGSAMVPALQDQFDEADLGLNRDKYLLWVIRVNPQPNVEEVFFSQYYPRFLDTIQHDATSNLVAVVNIDQNEYVAVIECKSEEEYVGLTNSVEELKNRLEEEIPNTSFYIGFGDSLCNADGMHEHYKQALERIGQTKVRDSEAPTKPWTPPLEMEQILLNGFQSDYPATVQKYVKELVEQAYEANLPLHEFSDLCRGINRYLLRIAEIQKPASVPEMLKIGVNMRFYTPEILSDIVYNNVSILCETSSNESSYIVERILQYTKQHFSENLNLAIVAQKFGYSANYLSRLFKQRQGIGFTDYVNQLKISQAKVLLRTTQKPIKQIAQEVGFSTSTFFIRTFVRYENITPKEYREMN